MKPFIFSPSTRQVHIYIYIYIYIYVVVLIDFRYFEYSFKEVLPASLYRRHTACNGTKASFLLGGESSNSLDRVTRNQSPVGDPSGQIDTVLSRVGNPYTI